MGCKFSSSGGFLVVLGCDFGFYDGSMVVESCWGVVVERERSIKKKREDMKNKKFHVT